MLKLPLLRSILDVKSSICFPCSVSTGSIQPVIIALVYSVNVCQMDTAVVAAECAAKGSPWKKKGKEKGGSSLISSFSFTSMGNSWLQVAQ